MLTDGQIQELLDEVRKMRIEIPQSPELYHATIMSLHKFLNELTDVKIMIAQEILKNPGDKDYLAKLKLVAKEVVDPALRQLTLGKQTFGMLINKGKVFGDEGGAKKLTKTEPPKDLAVMEFEKLMSQNPVDTAPKKSDNGFDFS